MKTLKIELGRRVCKLYENADVIVKKAGTDGLSILWAPNKDETKKFVEETLQDAWDRADDRFIR